MMMRAPTYTVQRVSARKDAQRSERIHVGCNNGILTDSRLSTLWAFFVVVRLWIALCFVLVAGSTYGFSKHQTKQYTATASLVFNNSQLNQQAAGLQVGKWREPAASTGDQPQARPAGRHGEEDRDCACSRKERDAARARSDRGRGQSGLERERPGRIERRRRFGDGYLADARRRNRERVHRRVRLRAAERNHAYDASALKLVEKQLRTLSPKAEAISPLPPGSRWRIAPNRWAFSPN